MSMAYTYLIGWSEQNRFYYGARWAKNCSPADLWSTYFTSSKHVKTFRKQYGDPDIIEVRKTFDNAEQCREYEHKTLRRLNVLKEDKWLNKNIMVVSYPLVLCLKIISKKKSKVLNALCKENLLGLALIQMKQKKNSDKIC